MEDAKSLTPRIRSILQESDLQCVTAKHVIRRLEAELGRPLDEQKKELKAIILEEFNLIHEYRNMEREEESNAIRKQQSQYPRAGMLPPGASAAAAAAAGLVDGFDPQGQPQQQQPAPGPKRRGRPPKVGSKKRKRQSQPSDPDKPKRQTGLSKPMRLSQQFQNHFNRTYMPRTQVVKGLWDHIKSNNLQDQQDKRYINCDDTLKTLFGVDRMFMYAMNKMLNDHLTKPETEDEKTAADAECGTSFFKPKDENGNSNNTSNGDQQQQKQPSLKDDSEERGSNSHNNDHGSEEPSASSKVKLLESHGDQQPPDSSVVGTSGGGGDGDDYSIQSPSTGGSSNLFTPPSQQSSGRQDQLQPSVLPPPSTTNTSNNSNNPQ